MTGARIPEPKPPGDTVEGVIARLGRQSFLALQAVEKAELVASGRFLIRYALPYLGKPHLALVPGRVVLDYGDFLTGEDAWEFLTKRSNLYPRADVVGYRTDGSDEMTAVKWLDLAQPIQVFAYKDEASVTATARLHVVIAPLTANLPARLLAYLPRFETIAEWQAAQHV